VLQQSNIRETEEGETGAAHFIGTTGGLPSDVESTSLLDFVVASAVSNRCRAPLIRSSSSPSPLCVMRTSFSVPRTDSAPSATSKWFSWSLCRREWFLSRSGTVNAHLCQFGSGVKRGQRRHRFVGLTGEAPLRQRQGRLKLAGTLTGERRTIDDCNCKLA